MSSRLPRTSLLLFLAALLAGCTGLDVLEPRPDSTRFYTLRAGEATTPSEAASNLAIAIGPTSIAAYLDRPAIAVDGGGNRIVYRTADRWAEPLDKSIERFMTHRLAGLLGTERVGSIRNLGDSTCDLRLGYAVNRLDGAPGEVVRLDVSWWVEDCEGNSLHYASDRLAGSREIDPKDISGYVGQIESVLDQWAANVAETIGAM